MCNFNVIRKTKIFNIAEKIKPFIMINSIVKRFEVLKKTKEFELISKQKPFFINKICCKG